jgi:MFS family permease
MPHESQSEYSHAWRALRHRNFRLFIVGQAISLIGTWMTRVAIAWLVYRLSKSAWMLGAIGFANQVPIFLLAPLAGGIIDRSDRRKLLTATQALLMVHSLLLAFLTLTNSITMPLLFVLSVAQGLVNTFDSPARQSFTVRMVGSRHDLQNAIAISSSMMNTARLIGPALAGLLIAASSEGWCFMVDGVSYGAVIISLLMMRMSADQPSPKRAGLATEIREGWAYVCASVPIRSMLLLFALICLIGWPFTVVLPIFAGQILHGGAHTLGYLLSALGVGALSSSVSMAMRRSVRGLIGQLPWVAMLFGAMLICFGLSSRLWLSLLLLWLGGFGLLRVNHATNAILQTIVDEEMRGRVMSYYTMALEGMAPWGSLFTGLLANAFGAPRALMVCGAACVLAGLWFCTRLHSIRKEIRPIYQSLGIIPAPDTETSTLPA